MRSNRNTRAHVRSNIGTARIAVHWKLLLATCLGAACAGCQRDNPFSQVQVSGTILYEDGSVIPVEGLKLWFDCQEAPKNSGRSHPRAGSAPVNVVDGTFSTATTRVYGDGLVRGKHKVMLDLIPRKEGPAQPVPLEFTAAATTPLVVDTRTLPLEIRIPRPPKGSQ